MRILLISPLPPPMGGIAHWTTLICKYAKKVGDEIKVINTSSHKIAVVGRSKLQRIVDGAKSIVSLYGKLKKESKDFRPEAAHICTSGGFSFVRDYIFIKCLYKRSIPCTYHLHFGKIPAIKEKNNWQWRLFLKNIAMAESIVAMNESTFEALSDVVKEDKLFNIPNPIDISILPRALDYSEHGKCIFYLGWIIRTKGIEELLTAWKQIKHDVDGWKIRLAGPCNNDYMEYLREKDLTEGVDFTGEIPHEEAMEYMKMAGIFVLPSYSEGFPNVVLEAMALKTPIIATTVGSIPEMLNGRDELCEPKNVEALANLLKSFVLSEEKRQICADKLHERVLQLYEISGVYELYKNVWNRGKNNG